MKITRIDCHVLLVPDYDTLACSSAQDNLVVEVHTDEGIVGIGIAASAHLCAATACCPYIEFLPGALAEIELRDGQIALPRKPGLGIKLNRDALEKYRVE